MLNRLYLLSPLALLLLTACPSDGGEDKPDGGSPPPDLCNTREEALSMPDCELALGVELERYISEEKDQDWYSVRIPATANARTLVRVTAGYRVPSTAVNLSVSLLREDGQASLARKVDAHGQGAPQQVEIILPFSEPNARLLLLLGDEPAVPTRPNFDARSPYFVKVEVLENPDANEPNDSPQQATALTLAPQGEVEVATQMGYLATGGDVDRFSFTVPVNKVAYVRLTADELTPPAAYRLSYVLVRPDGTAEAEGVVANTRMAVDLATARKVKMPGTWTVLLQGYRPPNETNTIPGDLRLRYQLEVQVMDEQDPQDLGSNDNNVIDRALVRLIGAGPGSSTTFPGRIGSESDADWYGVDVPASDAPTVLYYRLRSVTGGGRFPPLPGLVDRQVRVLTPVNTGTTADSRAACVSQAQVCPKGYSEAPGARLLVEGYCNGTVPLCLQSSREEDSNFPNLRNFEGAIPVPPHNGTARYYFLVQDDGNNWADDRNYELEVSWRVDQDEDDHTPPGGTEQQRMDTLVEDTSGATQLNGELTYGFGRLTGEDRVTGRGVRGPGDYDAVPSDVDSYVLSIPGGQQEPLDRTWMIQWRVQNLPDGGMPHGLALDLTFCDGDRLNDGGTCTKVTTGSRNAPLTLAYRGEPLRAWHSPPGSLGGLQPLYSREVQGNQTVVTVLPYACSCLEPRFVRGGTVQVDVSATERESYTPLPYSVSTAYSGYPKSYAADGGTRMCPAPQQDGGTALPDGGTSPVSWGPGCRFTLQP